MNNYMKIIINALMRWTEEKFTAVNGALNKKVDVVDGKGLSTEDYTTEEKNKLKSLTSGASSWNDLTDKPFGEEGDTVHQLDEKFIPDTIARVDYVDTKVADMVDSAPETLNTLNELAKALGEDPNFATTVATQIGTLEDKVGDKNVSEQINSALESYEVSWNDLTDKPFGEDGGAGAHYEWDGQWSSITNYEMGICKVSDVVPEIDTFIGARVVSLDYEGYTQRDLIIDSSNITYLEEFGAYVIMDSYHTTLAIIACEGNAAGLEAGVYLCAISTRPEEELVREYVASLTCNGSSSVKTLDEKYIPKSIARVVDVDEKVGNLEDLATEDKSNTVAAINEVYGKVDSMFETSATTGSITYDGSKTGRDVFMSQYYKIADLMDGYENLTFTSATFSTGSAINVANIVPERGDGYIKHGAYILVVTSTTVKLQGYTFTAPSTGIYFQYSGTAYPNYAEYSIESEFINESLIPDTIARKSDLAGLGSQTDALPLPPTAAVGQFIRVAAVDENGKVTATEAVDMEVLANAEEVAF